jgi:hypothetical protein
MELESFVKEQNLGWGFGFSLVETFFLKRLDNHGVKVEEFLNYLVTSKGYLLHGSTEDIRASFLKPGERGHVCATNLGSIALLKAVLSNRGANLKYPTEIDTEHPLEVTIEDMQTDTIRENGFVYVIKNTRGFEPGRYSWEKIAKRKVEIGAKIQVRRKDFTYPIYEMKKIRIQ